MPRKTFSSRPYTVSAFTEPNWTSARHHPMGWRSAIHFMTAALLNSPSPCRKSNDGGTSPSSFCVRRWEGCFRLRYVNESSRRISPVSSPKHFSLNRTRPSSSHCPLPLWDGLMAAKSGPPIKRWLTATAVVTRHIGSMSLLSGWFLESSCGSARSSKNRTCIEICRPARESCPHILPSHRPRSSVQSPQQREGLL